MVAFVIKCTTTWLGISCSKTPFPHNVFDIGFISRFSALLVFDLEDIGVICTEIFDLDPDKSRGALIRIHTSFSCYSSHLHPSCDEVVRIVASEVAL
jgi:hypothetical protein